jgi:hypothetical protein
MRNIADELRRGAAILLMGWMQSLWPNRSREDGDVHRQIGALAVAIASALHKAPRIGQ